MPIADTNSPCQLSMKPRVLPYLVPALFVASFLRAQSNSAAAQSPTVLSPFEVKTDRDVGFIASSSLAGGRMATDLRDTPVPYTVLTSEFLDALQLSDPNAALAWLPNTYVEMDQGQGAIFGTSVGKTLNSNGYTSRGINSGGTMRDFFKFDNSTDNYNVTRIDVARGANAALFGLSTYAGAISSTVKEAQLQSHEGEVSFSGGSWDNYRATADVNQPLGDHAAVRLMGLWMDGVPAQNSWIDGVFEKRKAFTVAGTWKPFPHTKLKLNFERFHRDQTAAIVSYYENFSGWDGKTVYAAPSNARTYGVTATDSQVYWTPNLSLPGATGPSAVWGNYLNRANRAAYYSSNMPILDVLPYAAPASRFDIVQANSQFRTDMFTRSTNFSPDMTAMSVLNLNTLEGSATQRIGRNLFVDLSGMYNRRLWNSNMAPNRGLANVFLDLDQYLVAPGTTVKTFDPTNPSRLIAGTDTATVVPNPNYLKPFAAIYSQPLFTWEDDSQVRLALGYVLDHTRFGSYQFSAIGGYYYQHASLSKDNLVMQETSPFSYQNGNASDPRNWANADSNPLPTRLYMRYYLDQKSRPFAPTSGTYNVLDTGTGTVRPVKVGYLPSLSSYAKHQTENAYFQTGASAKFFKDRLVLIGALRWDRFYATQENALANGMDYPVGWTSGALYRSRAPADYSTLKYVLRNADGSVVRDGSGSPVMLPANARPRQSGGPNNGAALPQYVLASQGGLVPDNDPYASYTRFQSDYNPPDVRENHPTVSLGSVIHATRSLDVLLNYSDTYDQPGGIVVGPDGAPLPTPHSKGFDYGLRYSFLNDSLFVTATRFEGRIEKENIQTQQYAAINNDYASMFNALYNTNKWNDFTAAGVNQQQFPAVPAGYQDIRDKKSEGYEFEVQGNMLPRRNLNIMGSVAYTDAYSINPMPHTLAFYNAWKDTLIKVLNDTSVAVDPTDLSASFDPMLVDPKFWPVRNPTPGKAYDFQGNVITEPAGTVYTTTPYPVYDPETGQPVRDASGNIETAIKRTPVVGDYRDAQNAINNWTNLQNSLKNLATQSTPQKVRALRNYTAKLYARYRFVDGPLTGLALGFGANYMGRQIIGNRAADSITVYPAGSTTPKAADNPAVGPTTYVYTPAFTLYNLTASYEWRLRSGRALLFNLTVNNLLDYDKPVFTGAGQVPAENPSLPSRTTVPLAYYYTTPRSFVLSTTLKF